jgi:hypothetical protein
MTVFLIFFEAPDGDHMRLRLLRMLNEVRGFLTVSALLPVTPLLSK